MKTAAVVIAAPAYVDWLRERCANWLNLTVLSLEEAVQGAPVLSSAVLLLVELDGPELHDMARLLDRLGEQQADLPIIALGNGENPEAMLVAMRAGARDFLVPGRDDDSATGQIERVLRRSGQRGTGRGQVFAVLSGHPHTGTAFLAEHLALSATEALPRNESVLMLDLAQPAAAVSVFLNTHQEYSALNAIQDAYRCDQTLVDTAFGRHSSGLHVLSLPETHIGPVPVESGELASLLDVLRGLFSLTVVSLDATLGLDNLRAVIERADRTLLLSDQTILNSRYNQMLLRNLRTLGCPLEKAGLVVERYHPKLGLEPEKLASLLQLPLLATLQGDGLNRVQAMNAGETLFSFAPRDEYGTGLRRLALQLLERRVHAEPNTPRSLIQRLLG